MKVLVIPLAILLVVGCSRPKEEPKSVPLDDHPQPNGRTVNSTEMKFEAWFPKPPAEEVNKTGIRYVLSAASGKGVYMLQCSALSPAVPLTEVAIVDRYFAAAKSGLADGSDKGGTVASEEKFLFVNKYPARKIDVALPNAQIYRIRLIHRGSHFYQIAASGPKEFVDSAETAKFLDSLKFID